MATALDRFRIETHSDGNAQERALPSDRGVLTARDLSEIQRRIDQSGSKRGVGLGLIATILGIYTAGLLALGFEYRSVQNERLASYEQSQQEHLAAYEKSQSEWLSAYKASMKSVTDDLRNLRVESVRKMEDLSARFDGLSNAILISNSSLDAAASPGSNHLPGIWAVPELHEED
ncbi:MAG: hypothetical protein ACR2RF_13840 [Geminicoccaceae bacterium]